MNRDISRNIRLGLFVAIGTFFLIFSLYLIGSKRNLFGSTFRINAMFSNVNGLVPGNNVRYAGIDVGTVEAVEIINDTSIKVVMVIEKKLKQFIKKNSIAAIGTDGLMGNKIVNITPVGVSDDIVQEGDTLSSLRQIDTDVVMRTLNTTNENVEAITTDLRNITRKINSSNTLWRLLLDTIIADNVKQAVVNIKLSGENTARITGDLSQIVQHIRDGKGSVGALLTDTSLAYRLEQAVVNIQLTGKNSAVVTGNLQHLTEKINKGEGAVGALLMDTTLVDKINQSMESVRKGTEGFNENMEAVKQVPFIRKYYRKKAKAAKK